MELVQVSNWFLVQFVIIMKYKGENWQGELFCNQSCLIEHFAATYIHFLIMRNSKLCSFYNFIFRSIIFYFWIQCLALVRSAPFHAWLQNPDTVSTVATTNISKIIRYISTHNEKQIVVINLICKHGMNDWTSRCRSKVMGDCIISKEK